MKLAIFVGHAKINSFDYRPSRFTSVEKFADLWEAQVLIHQKPSSVKAAESHLRTYIRKHLGKVLLHELTPQLQQNFVTRAFALIAQLNSGQLMIFVSWFSAYSIRSLFSRLAGCTVVKYARLQIASWPKVILYGSELL